MQTEVTLGHQEFQLPKMEGFLNLIFGYFGGWVSPYISRIHGATVDGSEIRQKPVDMVNIIYPIIYRVLYIPGGAGFLPSTVCSIAF